MTARHLRTEIIGFDSGWGCADHGCEDGPYGLEADSLLYALRAAGVQAKWRGPMGLKHLGKHDALDTKEKTFPVLLESLRRLSRQVAQAVRNAHVPLVIGGDHSSAIGTWSGTVAATQGHGKFGLIWLDAHLDAHTYATSSQGKWGGWWHGQPVSALLGHGLQELQHIGGVGAKLSPRHLSIIGPHSFEPAEKTFVEEHGVRVFYLEEVRRRGFKAVFAEAFARATAGTTGFGLTVDLDCFDPADAPGVGTMEETGLRAAEVLPIIRGLAHHPLFRAMEIAEFNPHNDKNGVTSRLITALAAAAFTKD